jgi:hypothetical protein
MPAPRSALVKRGARLRRSHPNSQLLTVDVKDRRRRVAGGLMLRQHSAAEAILHLCGARLARRLVLR